ncbi:MAG: sigma-54 dependent transcriptional regulator [Bacteroidales bacterium]|nr:sigma-54 dependent transcriptional regulator [Bacteroidales bacterium]
MAKSDIQLIKQRFGIIGNSPELLRAIDIAMQVAPTDLSVLITGESGVGKEYFPQIIHQNSRRKHGSYIAVNCGAIPEGTIDSELFGHEKGSFTGALSDRKGYFEEANGGTIFLDEVGELPLTTQARLLRVLESGEFIKVGSSKVLKTNVRIVAATNLNMDQAIEDSRFREDLYYRLNSVPIIVPPLRERGDDIYLLFRKFAADFAEKYRMPAIALTDEARRLITGYRFPGNIRQLKNITEQISIIEPSREITFDTLKFYLPNYDQERLPALRTKGKDERTFGSEREILYQVLFDMRKEIHDLKLLVHDIMSGNESEMGTVYPSTEAIVKSNPSPVSTFKIQPQPEDEEVNFTEEFEDEGYDELKTLNDIERELIRAALEKFKGKRAPASRELKISERTLYRKIKEYGLDT